MLKIDIKITKSCWYICLRWDDSFWFNINLCALFKACLAQEKVFSVLLHWQKLFREYNGALFANSMWLTRWVRKYTGQENIGAIDYIRLSFVNLISSDLVQIQAVSNQKIQLFMLTITCTCSQVSSNHFNNWQLVWSLTLSWLCGS